MAAGLHGSARTTPRIRAELQAAQASTRALAAQYGLNPKTVAKWRARRITADAPMGPRQPRSTTLTEAEEAIVVEFRRRTLLPLDDVMGCLREAIPKLSRSALHRCLERHGISRLPQDEEATSKRKRFAETTIGYVHIDICELRLAEGKLFMFLAIDRVSKFTHVAFLPAATKLNGAAFLRDVVAAFPYAIHTVLTDNGMAFADLPKYRDGATAQWMGHIFDRVCREHGIKHKLTKPYHPWTNGQAERMNRTVKEATIKAFHYPDLDALRAHVLAFVQAYNFGKHLKALRWRTPFQTICEAWTKDPAGFKFNPHHLIPGPHTYLERRWVEGCHNATQLWRELVALGFKGRRSGVRTWATQRRKVGPAPARPPVTANGQPWQPPSGRRVARILMADAETLEQIDRSFVAKLLEDVPVLAAAVTAAKRLTLLLRKRSQEALDDVLTAASATPLAGFVRELRKDVTAVQAALDLPWTTSPAEGQVNRIKLIKRSMYGRAGFDLLRARVLHTA